MKVSTKLFNEQQLRQFSNLNSEIQKLQDKISSGKNILVASDDPVGSVDLSGYKTVKHQLDQFLKNVNSSEDRLSLVDTNLQNLSTIMPEHCYELGSKIAEFTNITKKLKLSRVNSLRYENWVKIYESFKNIND